MRAQHDDTTVVVHTHVPTTYQEMGDILWFSSYETTSRLVGRHTKIKLKGLRNSPSVRTSSEKQAVNRVTGCTVYIWTMAAEVES